MRVRIIAPSSWSRADGSSTTAAASVVQWTTSGALVALRTYRSTLSPVFTRMGVACRFTPTCSRYASEAVAKDGFVRGSDLTVRRVARCGPWTPMGTRDEP